METIAQAVMRIARIEFKEVDIRTPLSFIQICKLNHQFCLEFSMNITTQELIDTSTIEQYIKKVEEYAAKANS